MAELNNSYYSQWNTGYTYDQMQQYSMYYGGYPGYYDYSQYHQDTTQYHEYILQANPQQKIQNLEFQPKIIQQATQPIGKGRQTLKKSHLVGRSTRPVQNNNLKNNKPKGVRCDFKHKDSSVQKQMEQQPQEIVIEENSSETSSSQSDDQTSETNTPKLKIEESSQELLEQLKAKGFTDEYINKTLISYFDNNLIEIQKCLNWCNSEEARKETLAQYQSNFIILKYLGFVGTQSLYHWQVLSLLQKNQNDLKASIEKLRKRVQAKKNNLDIDLKTKDCQFNVVDAIPENPLFLIDGFNVVRANKDLKNLMINSDPKCKLESVLRLKSLVQTLAPGYLVLDKKFQNQQAENQILKNIITIKAEKKVETVYADQGLKADDKIIQILKSMDPEKRQHVLLVTSDRLLIKQCQEICGIQLPSMGGKMFIKKCKLMIPNGLMKHKIIKGNLKKQKSKN